ncbi:flagellar filament capping protein FliD [candidate division KSB1 bacterium]
MAEIGSITSGANSIETLVQRFMADERRPVDDLESQKSELNRRQLVFSDLKTSLTALRDKARDFTRVGSLNTLNSKKATVSDSTYFTVEASSTAELGTHSIKVDRLATSDTGVSRQLDRDTVYEYSKGLQEFTLAIGSGEAETISITIEETDTNEDVLNKVAQAINDTDLEVSASVIYDTSETARLIVKGKETGSDNFLNMTELDGSNILRKLKFLTTDGERRQASGTNGGFLVQNIDDLDAKLNIDGIDIIKGSNEISDIITGVTIKLKQVQAAEDSAVAFSVENNIENAKKEIEAFLEKFNGTIKYLNEKTRIDTVTFKRGDLAGDVVFSGLKFSIRSMVAGTVQGMPQGAPQLLSQIGIELSREGVLSIKDSAKFEEALNTDMENVTKLFTSEDGIGSKMTELLDSFVNAGGSVDRSKQGIKRQISSIDVRIKNYEARFAIREQNLRQQFTELQKSLSLLNSQQAILQSYQQFNLQQFYGNSGGYGGF